MARSKVFVHRGRDRSEAAEAILSQAGIGDLSGASVLIKPNFNTSDPPPGSTDIATLRAVVEHVRGKGADRIIVGDRSGPANTRNVFEEKGAFDLAKELSFEALVFDELPMERYRKVTVEGEHWSNGFFIVKIANEVDAVIGLCCLKTHNFGGHFTMSLKLTTGMVHRNNMSELHSSMRMREMIAEMNTAYRPRFVLMDGVDAFFRGGPMTGSRWSAGVTFGSEDRVALDAVGVAMLKLHGTTHEIESKHVFRQDQIRRAVELGLGATGPDDIELVPVNDDAAELIGPIADMLRK
ncbi:MAG: DUF362 domain-containing protein [Euryarchaeota archaeon]|nr:DUF362 domain-containing protein [Euryarchaeota archaeon]